MRYGIIGRGRVRIDGRYEVRHLLIQFTQTVQVQRNPKPPKIDIFQGNRLGHDAQGIFIAVECDIIELLLQRPQFSCNGRQMWHLSVPPVQKRLEIGGQERDLVELPADAPAGVFSRC